MAFTPRIITDRIVQYPKRFKMKDTTTGSVIATYDLEADVGTVTEVGTFINKTYLQSIEDNLGQAIQIGDETNANKVTFSENVTDVDITSGETHSVLFGKILKSIKTMRLNVTNIINGNTSVGKATKLTTARTINGIEFDGTKSISIVAPANGGTSASCSGNSVTASKLETSRTINGVSFNGTTNINITAPANGGNADTVGGKSIWIGAEGSKGNDANTIYYCY